MGILDQAESERLDNENRANEYRQHLDSLAWQISDCQRKAEEAEAQAAEMDELLAKCKSAFTSEKKRLQAVSKSKAEEAKELEEQYKQLEGEWQEYQRKASISLDDIVSQMVEDRFMQLLKDSSEVS